MLQKYSKDEFFKNIYYLYIPYTDLLYMVYIIVIFKGENMPVTQNLLSLDKYFNTISGDKIFVNDFDIVDIDDKNFLLSKIKTVYNNTEVISTKPSCDCGNIVGKYRVGKVCGTCGTECRDVDEKVEPLIWLKAIEDDMLFLNPTIWLMISSFLCQKIDWLRWLSDNRYNPNVPIPDYIEKVCNDVLGGVRNYKETMSKIRDVLTYISFLPKFKQPAKRKEMEGIIFMFDKYPDCIFSKYLPIVNKKLFVEENTTKGKFINIITSDIVNVVTTWSRVCYKYKRTPREKVDRMLSTGYATILSDISRLYHNYFKQYLALKKGMLRKHAYGARSHFTFRNVIVSVTGRHQHDHIQVPYAIGPTVFRPHLLNKLLKGGLSYKQANDMLFRSVKEFNYTIWLLCNKLLEEAPNGLIPVISQRNPSLKQGSALLTYISEFKSDPEDLTVTLSALIAKHPNADRKAIYV